MSKKEEKSNVTTYVLTVDNQTGEVIRTQLELDDGSRKDVEVEIGGTQPSVQSYDASAFVPQQGTPVQIPGFTPSVVILVGGGAAPGTPQPTQPTLQPMSRTRPPAHIAVVEKDKS
ncbi:MAG: hypothetical protein ACL93V_00225 [Candidatus Electrothrix sp. YB6]